MVRSGDSQFPTWLFRIVVTSCAKVRSKRGVVQAHEIPLETPEGIVADHPIHPYLMDWSQDPETSSLSAEAREHLEVAIDRLSHEYKGVLVLRDVEGFSTADTAEILNLSPEAVKSRLHRARLFLREQLAHYFTESSSASASPQTPYPGRGACSLPETAGVSFLDRR